MIFGRGVDRFMDGLPVRRPARETVEPLKTNCVGALTVLTFPCPTPTGQNAGTRCQKNERPIRDLILLPNKRARRPVDDLSMREMSFPCNELRPYRIQGGLLRRYLDKGGSDHHHSAGEGATPNVSIRPH